LHAPAVWHVLCLAYHARVSRRNGKWWKRVQEIESGEKVVKDGERRFASMASAGQNIDVAKKRSTNHLALEKANRYTLTGVQFTGKPLSPGGCWHRGVVVPPHHRAA
jgi:hypothetical protein